MSDTHERCNELKRSINEKNRQLLGERKQEAPKVEEAPAPTVNAEAVAYAERVSIAREHGLPELLAARLVGSDTEALHKDAARLANSGLFGGNND